MPQVEPYSDIITAQKADQFFDQPQGGFREWLGVEFMPQVGRRIRAQPDIFAFQGFIAQQQAETPHTGQRVPHLLEAANAEIRRRDIDLLARFALQQVIQHVGKAIFDVVDDVGYAHIQYGFMTSDSSRSTRISLRLCVYSGTCRR